MKNLSESLIYYSKINLHANIVAISGKMMPHWKTLAVILWIYFILRNVYLIIKYLLQMSIITKVIATKLRRNAHSEKLLIVVSRNLIIRRLTQCRKNLKSFSWEGFEWSEWCLTQKNYLRYVTICCTRIFDWKEKHVIGVKINFCVSGFCQRIGMKDAPTEFQQITCTHCEKFSMKIWESRIPRACLLILTRSGKLNLQKSWYILYTCVCFLYLDFIIKIL